MSHITPSSVFLEPSLGQQQHEAEIVLRFGVALLGGETIPTRGLREVPRPGPISGRVHDAELTLCVHASELASAQEQPFELGVRLPRMRLTRNQEPDRIRMILRRSVSEELLHAVACGIVLTRSTPEIVIRDLVFCFGVALFDRWLPEAHDGVPVIGIERLFRFRQQLLAKAFLHGSILHSLATKLEDEEILDLADCPAP